MGFSLLTFQASVNGSSGYTQLNAISDSIYNVQNNKYLLDADHQLMFYYYEGATANRFRLNVPSLRSTFLPTMRPVSVNTTVPNYPNIGTLIDHAIIFRQNEEVGVDVANGGAEQSYVGLGVTKSFQPAPRAPVFTTRATGTTTQVSNSYSSCSLTYDDNLPPGTYAIVGAECVATNGIFFRLVLTGTNDRPGSVCTAAVGNRSYPAIAQEQRFGIWGTFTNTQLPRLEVMSKAADTAQTLFLSLVKVG
jgi:hypothetical protein